MFSINVELPFFYDKIIKYKKSIYSKQSQNVIIIVINIIVCCNKYLLQNNNNNKN